DTALTAVYTLSLHDALPIFGWLPRWMKLITWVPWLANGVLGVKWIRKMVFPLAGLDPRRGLPRFAPKPFRRSATVASHPMPASADRKSTRLNSSHVKISYAV